MKTLIAALVAATAIGAAAAPMAQAQPYGYYHRFHHRHFYGPRFYHSRFFCARHPRACGY